MWTVEVPPDIANDLHRRLQRATAHDLEFLVSFDDGFKIEIFANEHPPPHFRVKYKGHSNNFRISDCLPLNGRGLQRHLKHIRAWHADNKEKLIRLWNDTRPADCPVGLYRE